MKKDIIVIILFCLCIVACKQQAPQTSKQSPQDSLMVEQMQQKDSTIVAYVKSINAIQGSVDTLMREAKLLKRHGEPIKSDTANIADELRAIGQQMIKNQKTLAALEWKLKQSNDKNDALVDLAENLSKQLNEKDSEITVIQQELARTRTSLTNVVKQFNDSVYVIAQQRAQMDIMAIKGNTVYYVTGTEKNLANEGIISNQGGVIGLGRIPKLNGNMNSNGGFIVSDLTTLKEISLEGSFVELVTPHPSRAYKIISGSPDKLLITDPEDFWSKSKYMIAVVR